VPGPAAIDVILAFLLTGVPLGMLQLLGQRPSANYGGSDEAS